MELVYKFIENYLSKKRYPYGKLVSFGWICFCVVISQIYWSRDLVVGDYLYANFELLSSGEWWRAFTTTFLHADIKHLLSNSLMLFILSYFLTSYFGMIQSVLVPVIFGGLINIATLYHYGGDTTLVGASGVVYFMWGVWLSLYFYIQRQMSFWSRSLRVGSIFLILLVPTTFEPTTSYFAHYFGFAIGGIYGHLYYFIKRKKFNSYMQFKHLLKPNVEIDYDYGEKDDDYEEYF